MYWILIVLYCVEGFLMTCAGFTVISAKINYKRVGIISILHGVVVYVVRHVYQYLDIPLGTHTIVIALFLGIFVIFIGKQKILSSMIIVLVGVALLTFGDGVFIIPALDFLKVDIAKAMTTVSGILFVAFLDYLPMIVVILLGQVFKCPMLNIKQLQEQENM